MASELNSPEDVHLPPGVTGVSGVTGGGAEQVGGGSGEAGGRRESLAALGGLASRGDRVAFEAIHRRLAGGLMRMLWGRVGGRTEVVDDLSQRTWLAVWEAFVKGRYDPSKSAVTTFVYAVGYKMWLQSLRTAGRGERLSGEIEEVAGSRVGSEGYDGELSEVIETVRVCLRDAGDSSVLTEEERGIVRATAGGASDREIARELQIAASTLNARKQVALGKIRRFLALKGFRDERTEQG